MADTIHNNSPLGQEIEIYTLTDPRSREIRYVGQGKSAKRRLKAHLWESNLKVHTHKTHWIKELLSLNLLPISTVIDTVSFNEANFWEKYYMDLYETQGHRLTNSCVPGCVSGRTIERKKELAIKRSKGLKGKNTGDNNPSKHPEVRRKISEALKGRQFTSETKKKMSDSAKGKTISKETRIKMSLSHVGKSSWNKGICIPEKELEKRRANGFGPKGKEHFMFGKTHTKEVRENLSALRKGKPTWGKKIKQLDCTTLECIQIFSSGMEASRKFKVSSDYIANACRKNLPVLGYRWEYEKEENGHNS